MCDRFYTLDKDQLDSNSTLEQQQQKKSAIYFNNLSQFAKNHSNQMRQDFI